MQLMGEQRAAFGQAGFSIGEVLVTVTLALVVMGSVARFNGYQLVTMQDQARQNALQMGARAVVDLFTREVRRAGANPTCASGITALADGKRYQLRLLADLNGDGATTAQGEDVIYVYRFDRNRLERSGPVRGTDALLDGAQLSGSRMRYFDQAGVELDPPETGLTSAQRAAVRRIRIELVATRPAANPLREEPLRVELANDIQLRNRFFGAPITCP